MATVLSEHACWLPTITREIEFSLFQGAEDGDFSDDRGNLFNVHREGDEYIQIGTKGELLAIFWNPHSNAEWHGHPRWPIRLRGSFNRKDQNYWPSRVEMDKMVKRKRISQRDAELFLRGDSP